MEALPPNLRQKTNDSPHLPCILVTGSIALMLSRTYFLWTIKDACVKMLLQKTNDSRTSTET